MSMSKSSSSSSSSSFSTDEKKSAYKSAKEIVVGDVTDFVTQMALLVQYQGYDPVAFFEVLKTKAAQKGISDAQMRDDLVFACTLLFSRGAAITKSKVKERTSAPGYQKLEEFISRWDIISGNPTGSSAVTVARMCGTVVHLAIKVANTLQANTLLRVTCNPVGGLVPCLCQPIMASILPKHNKKIYEAFKLWSTKFSEVIASGNSLGGRGTGQTDYVYVTWSSNYYTDEERKENTKKAYLGTPVEWYRESGLPYSAMCVNIMEDDEVTAYINRVWNLTGVAQSTIRNGKANTIYNAFLKQLQTYQANQAT